MYSLVHEWDDNFLVFFFFFLSFLLLVHRIDWDRTFANWCMMRCKLWWTATMNINLAAGVKVCSTPWTRPGELFKRTFGYNIWQCNEMGGAAGDERQQKTIFRQNSISNLFLLQTWITSHHPNHHRHGSHQRQCRYTHTHTQHFGIVQEDIRPFTSLYVKNPKLLPTFSFSSIRTLN